jgi:hypothetical protein
MMNFLAQINWTVVLVSFMISWTTLHSLQHLRHLARIWLDGLRLELQIQMLIHGQHSEWRGTQGRKGA